MLFEAAARREVYFGGKEASACRCAGPTACDGGRRGFSAVAPVESAGAEREGTESAGPGAHRISVDRMTASAVSMQAEAPGRSAGSERQGVSGRAPCRVTVQPVRFQKFASVVVSVTLGVPVAGVVGDCCHRVMPALFEPKPIVELT